MSVLFYELKKSLYYGKGVQISICFFLFYLVLLILMDTTVNPQMDYYKQEYNYYLNILDGRANENKISFLENESVIIAQTKISMQKLYDNYYDGEIAEIEFNSKLTEYQQVLSNQTGFDIIYKQFLYVNENQDARYFTYTNGWHSLLSNHFADYILIVLVVILVIPSLCNEYNTKMNSIAITTKYGSNITVKIVVSLTFAISISLASSFIKYLFFDIKYGLYSLNYPLESVELFANTSKSLSLISTFVSMSIIRIIGFILLATSILFVCSLLKRTSICVFCTMLILLLPEMLLNQNTKNILPLPTTLIFNNSLFIGEQTEIDFITKESQVVFNEASVSHIFLLIGVAILICCVLLCGTKISTRNKFDNNFFVKGRVCVLMIGSMALFFTGCTQTNVTQEKISYNLVSEQGTENEYFTFFFDQYDYSKPLYKNKNSGETNSLIRTPFVANKKILPAIYSDEKYVYYAYVTQDKSDFRFIVDDKISFIRVDLDTFEETVYFEKSLSGSSKWYMLQSFSKFFVQGDNLYIIGSEIYKINTKVISVSVLDISVQSNIAFDGRNIFYIGEKSNLYCYDTFTNTSDIYKEIVASSFYLTDNNILYVNRKDGSTLYIYDKSCDSHTQVYDKEVSFFKLIDDIVEVTTKTLDTEILYCSKFLLR